VCSTDSAARIDSTQGKVQLSSISLHSVADRRPPDIATPPAAGGGDRVGRVRPRPSRPAGDTGDADPAVAAILAAYQAGEATEHAALSAVAATRLLVPIVAVLAAANDDGTDKETEMALPTLIGNDGRAAVIAFTSADSLSRWRRDARPVPVPGPRLWAAARTEADAVVVDIAGPVPLIVEGARLAALAAGQPPPPAHLDPDIRATVAEIVDDFTLVPGAPDADLEIAFRPATQATATEIANQLAARLQPRLHRLRLRLAD
jgi:SseB protein N-terminal domain